MINKDRSPSLKQLIRIPDRGNAGYVSPSKTLEFQTRMKQIPSRKHTFQTEFEVKSFHAAMHSTFDPR